MTWPFASMPSAITAGLNSLKYGSVLAYAVRLASCPFSPSERPSVNGTVNTSGSVPAASSAANVGPVQSYWTDVTLIVGFCCSNSATCLLNSAAAAGVLPGISERR